MFSLIKEEILLFVLLPTIIELLVQPVSGEGCKRRVCFYDSYEIRDINAAYSPGNIDLCLCTHIVYFGISFDKMKIVAINETELQEIVGFKKTHRSLKVLVYIYGFYCDTISHSVIGQSESSRKQFAHIIIQYIREKKFDGLVFGCLYLYGKPINPLLPTEFTNVIIALNQTFSQEATGSERLELVLYAHGRRIFDSYEIYKLSPQVDWIILDIIDLQDPKYNVTGHHSPLYPNACNQGSIPCYSIDRAILNWTGEGAPSDKLVIDLPAFGVEFTLTSSESGVGAPTERTSKYRVGFSRICGYLQNGVKSHLIEQQRVPYLVNGKQWIGYDDVDSLREKVRYIKKQKLGGFYMSGLHFDDPTGKFCGRGPYPLLHAINDECLKS